MNTILIFYLKMTSSEEFYVIDISTLELILSKYTRPIPELLSEYKSLPKNSFNLLSFMAQQLGDYDSDNKGDEILREIIHEIGLEDPLP